MPIFHECISLYLSAMCLHYDTTGPRWLALGSTGRKLLVYDIRNLSQPVLLKEESCKNVIRDLDWPILYESLNIAHCDSINLGKRVFQELPMELCLNGAYVFYCSKQQRYKV